MNFETNNGILTILTDDHIDSANAAQTEETLFKIIDENPHSEVVLDFENLRYISSAGLRILLRIRKKEELKLINVKSDVYEILEMTGFTEMIDVKKAYRRFSVENCEKIAEGANGIVYRLDAETIIKVYKSPDCLPDIQRERDLARKALILGIPTAIPYDVAKVGDSYGSVFELLNAKSFSKLIAENPDEKDYYTKLFVDLLKKIHSTQVREGEMPDMKATAMGWVEFLKGHLSDDIQNKLVNLVKAVPAQNTMIHGDYHLRNVMMQNGEVLLIDMDTLSMGYPLFEFASIYLGFVGFGELDHDITLKFMGLPYETTGYIWQKTLELYFGTEDKKILGEIADKAGIIAYSRLLRRTIRRDADTEHGKRQIELCKRRLTELVNACDSLELPRFD